MLTPDPFTGMTLLRVFHTLDMAAGTLIRHEVRRDVVSGLTLTRKSPVQPATATERK